MSPTSSAEQPVGRQVLPANFGVGVAELTGSVHAVPITGDGDTLAVSPAIHTIELRKQYRRTVALAGLSISVRRGEIFGFLGPNGAGKTTAVKLLLGLVRSTGGEAIVLGAPVGDIDVSEDWILAGAVPVPKLVDG